MQSGKHEKRLKTLLIELTDKRNIKLKIKSRDTRSHCFFLAKQYRIGKGTSENKGSRMRAQYPERRYRTEIFERNLQAVRHLSFFNRWSTDF